MKKVLFFSLGLIFIGNYLFAAAGDYNSVASGNWNATATWNADYGLGFVTATDYPGQNPGTGAVVISTGDAVILNVSPNAIGSFTLIAGGNGAESLTISPGFILNVTGNVLIAGTLGGGPAQDRTLIMNGVGAILNCGSLIMTPGVSDTKNAVLQFNGAGLVHVASDANLSTAQPQRTQVNFNGGGTLTVDGTMTGGQISVVGAAATSTINADPMTPGNIIMNSAGSILDMNGIVNVSGTLTLTAGKIDLGSNFFRLTNATPATQLTGGNSTSYVYTTTTFAGYGFSRNGLTAATNFTFPVGTPTDYMPVIVNTAAGTSDFTMSVRSPAASNGAIGGPAFGPLILPRIVNAMWSIDRPVGSGNSAITLGWVAGLEGATFAGLPNTSIGISRHDGTSWSFPPIQTSGNNTTNIVTANFSAFGVFSVADVGQALPVKFGAIKAYEKLNGIQLDWKVYTENKIKSYEIERSADGRSYTTVGSLAALYNNINEGNYGFFDANPLPGTSYYRIKNNDLDGRSAYSIVIRVNRNKTIKGLSLYPNPVLNSIVSLQGSDLGRGIYKISIFGANGQEIYKQQIKHNGGTISQTIELPPTINKGIYMFTVKDENGNIIFNDKLVNQ